jgi:hypothetical protein
MALLRELDRVIDLTWQSSITTISAANVSKPKRTLTRLMSTWRRRCLSPHTRSGTDLATSAETSTVLFLSFSEFENRNMFI